MATLTDIHVGDVGTVFVVTIQDDGVPVDLSTGTSASNIMIFRKPDGEVLRVSTNFYSDGSDGKIKYTVSSSSVIDQYGTWKISANVNTDSGQWTATASDFTVLPVF